MSPLELRKVKLELMRVTTARHELEIKIDERMEEIDRIKTNIQIQLNKEEELTAKIKAEDK